MSFAHTTVAAYLEVITINLVLSGDNVVVIGMAAAGLAKALRQKAIVASIAAAAVIRVVFALIAVQLLEIPGIMLIGGMLLFWVCWNMFQELRSAGGDEDSDADPATTALAAVRPAKALRTAILQIVVADVSMSLDNVLAVAGAAAHDMNALVFGLILSVVLMAVASTLVAALLARYRWIGWLGLAIIVYVAGNMTLDGIEQVRTVDFHALLSSAAS